MIIFIHVPVFEVGGVLYFESQACNGLRLWAANFDRVILMTPIEYGPVPTGWEPLLPALGADAPRIQIESLPTAYREDQFLRQLGPVRRRMRKLIAQATHICFSIAGLTGDWGSVACWEAHRMGRDYAVWTDRVESQVVRKHADNGPWRRRLRARLTHRPMAWLERIIIRRAALGLFHGRETYEAYAHYCVNPHVVHNIHVAASDHIPREALAEKISTCDQGPIRLVYVGRMDPMKGPLDWVAVLEKLERGEVDFQATWLGVGSEEEAVRGAIATAGIEDRVTLPGFTTDQQAVLNALRQAHVFLFCHKTPESPRCLIEALISGTPIVGYDSAFPSDLIQAHQGGILTEHDNVTALARAVLRLAADRTALAQLIDKAARDGAPFDDVSVFQHRSTLIKRHLRPRRTT